ncbi:MAG: PaaI family thioesterase, partial [Spirochaetaceae bacterium]|nr:PaaI family thioesterase [Spirochaetaceae bacterium]
MNIDLDKLRDFFLADRYATGAGVVIDAASSDTVQCSMEIKDSHRNGGGNVHGGAIFTLADFTFGVHSNLDMIFDADTERGLTVGQSCSISYLKSSKGTRLIAESVCLHRGRTMSVYRIT